MSVLQKIIGRFLRPHVRRMARGKALEQVIGELEAAKQVIMPLVDRAQDSAGNREAINHFIGIERWGANRVRVAKGEVELEQDSNRRYRLSDDASLEKLQQAFKETRQATLTLARSLKESGARTDTTVPHNDLGPLTVIEWLVYVNEHSLWERRRLKVKPG